tara:strand:+ start:276 stop:554 length:279 start_codon:yes stop_codon:yes gene_type:complete
MPTITKTIEIEVDIEYSIDPGEPQSFDHPGAPASADILSVRVGMVNIVHAVDQATMEEMLETCVEDIAEFEYDGPDNDRDEEDYNDNELSEA